MGNLFGFFGLVVGCLIVFVLFCGIGPFIRDTLEAEGLGKLKTQGDADIAGLNPLRDSYNPVMDPDED